MLGLSVAGDHAEGTGGEIADGVDFRPRVIGKAPDQDAADIRRRHAGEFGGQRARLRGFAQRAVAESLQAGVAEFGDEDRFVGIRGVQRRKLPTPEARGFRDIVIRIAGFHAFEPGGVAVDAEQVVQWKMRRRRPDRFIRDMYHQPRGVQCFRVRDERVIALAHAGPRLARLVAYAPDDDRGVAAVAGDERGELAPGGVQLAGIPRFSLIQARPPVDGYLTHRQQAQFVAQVQLPGMVRVVRQPHEIRAGLAHGKKVPAGGLQVHRHACVRRIFVAVETAQHDGPAVEQQAAVFHGDGAEADARLEAISQLAIRPQLDARGIQRGIVRRP
ncbi:MAG: hypothetical protein BWY76_03384 [bacterium ADurb.Bin429]|nr:MAG: hypothetical protein BWY76_03384 [bacterium ADurb.Bin429]